MRIILITVFTFLMSSYVISSIYKEKRLKAIFTKNDFVTFRDCAISQNRGLILLCDWQCFYYYKTKGDKQFVCTDSLFYDDHIRIPKARRDSILERFLYLNVNSVFCHSQKLGMKIYVTGLISNDIMVQKDTFKIHPFYQFNLPQYPGTVIYF